MNRLSTQIISIFFWISAFCLPCRLFAAISVAPGLSLERDDTGYDQEYLRNLVRQLDRYARMAKLRRSADDVLIIKSKGNLFGFYGKKRLYVPGNSNDWMSNGAVRRKLVALLASHRFGFYCPPDSPGVAWWMLYGLEAEVAAGVSSGQFLVANRDYRLLSEFCSVKGAMPDFAAMCRMGEIREPVMNRFAGEQARLLLLIMAENGRIGELFRRVCGGENADCFMSFYPSPREAQSQLSARAEKFIWNRYHPMSAQIALKRLPLLTRCFIPNVDSMGRPTADFMECEWEAFADALKVARSDSLTLRKRFAGNFIELGKMLPVSEAAVCNDLAAAAMDFGSTSDNDAAKKKFSSLLRKLETMFKKRIDAEKYFRSVLVMQIPVPDNFQLHFDAVKNENPAASWQGMQFLQQVMREYLE